MNKNLAQEELVCRMALTSVPMVGDVLAKNLIAYCGNAADVFKQKKAKLLRIPGIGEATAGHILKYKDFGTWEKELEFIRKHEIEVFFHPDPTYPTRLKSIPDAPFQLFYKGNANLNHPKIVGVVGTRQATEYGRSICQKLIEDLSAQDIMVVSGLAYGIDIAAHKAAIKYGLPTVGVLAHGLDTIYPGEHQSTALRMVDHGGILSEYPSGTSPEKEHFPTRNRIVAGMCDAVVVVEATLSGGALITAEYANNYNRDVFAFPGRTHDGYSKGCHKLIKSNKAALLEDAADLIYLMGWEAQKGGKGHKQTVLKLDLSPLEQRILEILDQQGKTHIDEITYACETGSGSLALLMLNLELNGLVKALPGNYYAKG